MNTTVSTLPTGNKVSSLLGEAKKIVATAQAESRDLTDPERDAIYSRLDAVKELRNGAESDHGTYSVGDYTAKERHSIREITDGTIQRRTIFPDPNPQNGDRLSTHGRMAFTDNASGQQLVALNNTDRLASSERVGVGDCVRALVTGRTDELSPRQQAALVGGSDSGGGYLLAPQMSREVLDLARSASVCIRAGARTVPMGTSELDLTRLTGDPTAHWRPEKGAVTTSDLTFDRVRLQAKTLAAIVPVSLEIMEDASNAGQVIQDALTAALGLALDQAGLKGGGYASAPLGIRNAAGVNSVGSVGTPTNYSAVTQAVGEILNDNYVGDLSELAWVAHPVDAETYASLTDTLGQPLQPGPWVAPLKRFYTTSMPQDEGSGTDSSMIVGHFPQLLFGMRTSGVMIRVLDSGTVTEATGGTINAPSQLMRYVVAHLRADVAILRPTWFCNLTGLVTS